MKKKWMGILTAAVLAASQVMCVCASPVTVPTVVPSTTDDSSAWYEVSTVGDMNEYGVVTTDTLPAETQEKYQALAQEAPEILNAIREFNNSVVSLRQFVEQQAPELTATIGAQTAITPIFDISPVNGGQPDAEGNHTVSITMPGLTRAMTNVRALHLNMDTRDWEVLPVDVDYETNTLTIHFGTSLSPVVIVADVAEGAAAGTSPKTGVASDWGMWMAAAVVLAVVSVGSYKKMKDTRN